ncbi:MAB_1171c family putative transporter [Streptomyces brasiliscabiei]|uniref:MAB_1171c family putative transporter n=1 Tax=Streptomyces brasiliscabiei TaxID=2736302 RepID=UPI001C107C67|nr:MAB_1171c family putative transporter [Streptomyces brasiliscabiei]
MKDLLHPISLVVAVLGFLCLLRDLPTRRRDPATTALAAVFLLSGLSFLFSITPMWNYLDRVLGTVNVSVPLAQGCVIALIACQQVVLTYWGSPPDIARRRARVWLGAGLAVIAGLLVLFALLTPSAPRPIDFTLYYAHDNMYAAYLTLYVTAYTVGEVLLARGCWRLARRSQRTAVRVGLRIVALGAVVTFGYSGVRTGNVIAPAFGISLAGWENFAWTCGDVGAMLTLIGWLVPTITDQAQSIRYWIKQHRSYRDLRPLWLAFYSEAPEIALPTDRIDSAQRRRMRGIGIKLYRRAVEIRDGRFVIREYLDTGVRESSEAHHQANGLHSNELNAAVTADQILAGIAARAAGNRPSADRLTDFADADRQTSSPMDDIDALLAVARHLPREPARTPHPERASA